MGVIIFAGAAGEEVPLVPSPKKPGSAERQRGGQNDTGQEAREGGRD